MKGIVVDTDEHTVFTKEVLKAQDGKEVPLTLETGGPVIGKATLHYHEESGELRADFEITDPKVKEFLENDLNPRGFEG
jgi:hypothetical protein